MLVRHHNDHFSSGCLKRVVLSRPTTSITRLTCSEISWSFEYEQIQGAYLESQCLMTIASTDCVMNSKASGESSVLFLMKECRGLNRFSCLLTVLFCTKSLSFLIILLTKDFTGSRKLWQVTATFCKLLFKSYLIACSKLLPKLAFTFCENSNPSLVFSTIFCTTISPTFCCCSTSLLKAAGENSALATLSRYLLTNLNASLRKSGRVPGSIQACLKMMSIHFSKSGSLLDRSKMFFSRTMTHIFRFQPWLSLS